MWHNPFSKKIHFNYRFSLFVGIRPLHFDDLKTVAHDFMNRPPFFCEKRTKPRGMQLSAHW